jgi:hypothetical protein
MHYQSKTTKKLPLYEFHSNQSKTTNSMTANKVKQPKNFLLDEPELLIYRMLYICKTWFCWFGCFHSQYRGSKVSLSEPYLQM